MIRGEMVGDPGIEPGMGLPGGVTVRCRTLQHVARRWRVDTEGVRGRQAGKSVPGRVLPNCRAQRRKGVIARGQA